MSVAELHDLSACEAVERLVQREVSPVELLEALLRRIDALEGDLHAWALLDRERALAAARRSESELFGGRPGPLEGLPLGIKDIYSTAGVPTEANSPLLKGFVPDEDAPAVGRLREAGAIILGKTVTTQFADGDPAATRNPWNRDRTPGGSSSGSAAAVAARMVPAALGSQTAGSVLRPAAYCGVVGLKPTFGRISRRNVFPFAWSLDTMGVLARSVRDTALLLQVLAGYDPADSGSEDRPVDDYRAAADSPRAPRLGLIREYLEQSESDVGEHLREVARRLERAGAEVREVAFPGELDLALACHHVIQNAEAGELHARLHGEHPDGFLPRLRAAIEVGQLVPGYAYVRAQRWRRRFRMGFDELLGGLDALLLPTASNVAPDLSTTGDTSFQAVITMLGLPAITLPTGLNADGLPFGTQLVGRAWDEAGLLSAASWCEQEVEPLTAPC